jgi:D-serine deaminase-like pyridoxal phosphate-dependent protein
MRLSNEAEIHSPSLVLHLERVEENMRRMVEIAGGPRRLRPHVKTHKLAPLITKQITLGIHKFKCATIAEAEMVAAVGGTEVLLAHNLWVRTSRGFYSSLKNFQERTSRRS